MRDPFKDSGSADDWFNNLWTAEVDMSTAMYGNTGTDMLYKSLIPKSPELTDIVDRATNASVWETRLNPYLHFCI